MHANTLDEVNPSVDRRLSPNKGGVNCEVMPLVSLGNRLFRSVMMQRLLVGLP